MTLNANSGRYSKRHCEERMQSLPEAIQSLKELKRTENEQNGMERI